MADDPDEGLLSALGSALAPPPRQPPDDRVAALRAAVDADAAVRRAAGVPEPSDGARRTALGRARRAPVWARVAVGLVGVAALVAAFFLGWSVGGRGDDLTPVVTAESVEGIPTRVEVGRTPTGADIRLTSDAFPPPGADSYYEAWLVRPGDGAGSVVSVGTFVPRSDGSADVRFPVGVDVGAFPSLVVTLEPATGTPGPDGPAVARIPLPVGTSTD